MKAKLIKESINESNSESFKFPNVPHANIDKGNEWIRNNSHIARRKVGDSDKFTIEVFGYRQKKVADDLYKALSESGFLDEYPLFSIKISPIQ